MTPEQRIRVLTTILRRFAWAPSGGVPGRFEVWASRDGQEVLIPVDPRGADFERLLNAAEQEAANRFGRPGADVRSLVEAETTLSLDSTQWRRETPGRSGFINWIQGDELYNSARRMMTAAAKAVREKRLYHGNASSWIARRFLEEAYMGQTEVGSFVITALTPAHARLHLSEASEHVAPLNVRQSQTVSARTVVDTLASAVEAVRHTLDNSPPDESEERFLPLVAEGVSYEMLDALAIVTGGAESSFKVRRAESGRSTEVVFEPPDSAILARAAHVFAVGDDTPQPATLLGDVTLLQREADHPSIIRLDLGDRKVRVRLDAEQYKKALEAHGDEALLTVRGTITKEGNQFWMYDVQFVEAIEKPDDVEVVADPPTDTALWLFDGDGEQSPDGPGSPF